MQELISKSQGELIQAGDTRSALAFPVHVIPPERVTRLDAMTERALSVEITDDTYQAASETQQALKLEMKAQADYVTELRRPYSDTANRISAASKDGLALPERALDELGAKLTAYLVDVERRKAEARRIQAEAAEAQRREQDRLRAEADAKRIQAERLAWESEQREAAAARQVMEAKTDAERLAAAEAFRIQAEQQTAAEQARLEAEAAERQAEAPVQAPVAEIVVPEPKGGAKLKQVPKLDGEPDMDRLPTAYHLANEKLILKHLADGIKIPGVAFHFEAEAQAKRGSLR